MIKDIFTFGEHPQIDGSIPVLKNGLATTCPSAHIFAVENDKILGGKPLFLHLACNKSCSLLLQVERALKSDLSQVEHGFIQSCASSPQFIQISEPKSKLKLIK
jgi:hypothetical protein